MIQLYYIIILYVQHPPLDIVYLSVSGKYLCNHNHWCKKPECIRAETKFFLSETFIREAPSLNTAEQSNNNILWTKPLVKNKSQPVCE